MIFEWIELANGLVWGIPGVGLILGVGLWVTVRCRLPQIRFLPSAFRDFFGRLIHREEGDGTSSFRALCTALAATVGTGNIAGVAGAISIGGPGAIFWMWIGAFVGMATKFGETTLAVRFRKKNGKGEWIGGPMYIIHNGLGQQWKWLGCLYSFFGLTAAFGVGNATQINAVITSMEQAGKDLGMELSPYSGLVIGIVFAAVICKLVSGGAGKVGEITEVLIPFVSAAYIILCLAAIGCHMDRLPEAVSSIIEGAFCPRAVTGGAVGSTFLCIRIGISRGVFTNEAGMGTAAIAHGSAEVSYPAQQGLMGIMEVFLDTIVICTMTALVILTSGISIPYGTAAAAELTSQALTVSFGPWVSALLCACLCLFALATILGWGLYAGRCVEYLFESVNWKLFALLQAAGVLLGAVLDTGTVWAMSELMNGLMAFPNLLALMRLTPELVRLTKELARDKNVLASREEM